MGCLHRRHQRFGGCPLLQISLDSFPMHYFAVLLLFLFLQASSAAANPELSLQDAEASALASSWNIKAAAADFTSAIEQEKVGFTAILPRASLQGNYTFISTLPQLSVAPNVPAITFGDHNNYSLGPVLNYTLWDTFSSHKSYASLGKVRQAREQDRENTTVQVLAAVRSAYLRVQLALEELKAVDDYVTLARAQERDVQKRFKGGLGTKLEIYTAARQVLRYRLQYQQKQADVATAYKDLLALTNPENLNGAPKIEPLSRTLANFLAFTHQAPDENHPRVRSLELLSESSTLMAESLRAKLFPTLQLTLSSNVSYPNGPQLININQNTVILSLNVPLFLGDPTWHQIDQRLSDARGAHYRAMQVKLELNRDYEKALQMIDSLKRQQKLAWQDVKDAHEVASLYFNSYKAGKLNFIDVQTTNNDALQAKVNAARIDAQLIGQLISLLAVQGKEGTL